MQFTGTFHKEKYYSLDFLRGVAAFIVAMAHFSSYGEYSIPASAGGLCVAYFFVLSGFVLSHAYGEQIAQNSYKFRDFLIARVARLYPLHLLTFILVAAYWGTVYFAMRLGFPINSEPNWSWLAAFENITLTQLIFSGAVSFNSPAWSIGVEFWCGFFIFFLCLSGKGRYKTISILAVTLLYTATWQNGGFITSKSAYTFGFIEKNFAAGLVLFSAGWLTYRANRLFHAKNIVSIPAILPWLSLLLFSFLVIYPPVSLEEMPPVEALYFILIAVSVLLLSLSPAPPKTLAKIMSILGDMSYGIYLWHVPIMLGLTAVCKIVAMKFGYEFLGSPFCTLAFFILVLVVAYVSYNLFERPAKDFIRQKFSHKKVSAE